jgi:hypothetical protein
MGEINQKLT